MASSQPFRHTKLVNESKSASKTQLKASKTRRGNNRKYRNSDSLNKQLICIGTNSAGLNPKKESLFQLINKIKPSVLTIQETKFMQYRMLKLEGYEIFENIRTETTGGGLLTAVDLDLNPFLISKHGDVEIMVVQFEIIEIKLRIINGYGPQEDDDASRIKLFWHTIETEVEFAMEEGCLIIFQCDANAKVGYSVVKGDPNPMSSNGKILLDLINRKGESGSTMRWNNYT